MEMRNSYSRIPGLLDSRPLLVMPELAVALGLNEAIFVQQLHYWLKKSNHVIDGRRWVYNTIQDWQKQFPWWSRATIGRITSSLEEKGIILVDNFNEYVFDRTKWYTIDFEALDKYVSSEKEETKEETVEQKEVEKSTPAVEEKDEEQLKEQAAIEKTMKENGIFMSRLSKKQLACWFDVFNGEMIEKAVEMTLYHSANKWSYVDAVLKHWHKLGFKTVEDIEKHEAERKKKSTRSQSAREEVIPSWMKEHNETKNSVQRKLDPDDIEKRRRELMKELGIAGDNDDMS